MSVHGGAIPACIAGGRGGAIPACIAAGIPACLAGGSLLGGGSASRGRGGLLVWSYGGPEGHTRRSPHQKATTPEGHHNRRPPYQKATTERGCLGETPLCRPTPRGKLRGIRSRPPAKEEIEGDQIQADNQGGN